MIWIDGCYWRLCFVDRYSPWLRRNDGGYALGCTDCGVGCIFIANGLTLWQFRNVLCHELTHALAWTKGINIPEETEELMCAFVERWADDILLITYKILDKVV